jgi:hypothetical protein
VCGQHAVRDCVVPLGGTQAGLGTAKHPQPASIHPQCAGVACRACTTRPQHSLCCLSATCLQAVCCSTWQTPLDEIRPLSAPPPSSCHRVELPLPPSTPHLQGSFCPARPFNPSSFPTWYCRVPLAGSADVSTTDTISGARQDRNAYALPATSHTAVAAACLHSAWQLCYSPRHQLVSQQPNALSITNAAVSTFLLSSTSVRDWVEQLGRTCGQETKI